MSIRKSCSKLLAPLISVALGLHVNAADTASYINRMLTVVNQNIGSDPINVITKSLNVNEYTRVLEGKASYWGIGDVDYKATFNSFDSLMSFSIVMPPTKTIKLDKKIGDFISRMLPGFETLYLPKSLRINLLFDSCRLEFDDKKAMVNKVFVDFNVPGIYSLFDEAGLSLSKITVGYTADGMIEKEKHIEAEMAAEVEWAGTSLRLSSNLPKDSSDWKIEAEVQNVTIQSVMDKFNIKPSDLFIPPFFPLDKGLQKCKMIIAPFSGVDLLATTDIGEINVVVKYLDSVGVIKPPLSTQLSSGVKPTPAPTKYENKKGWGVCAGIALPETFTFKSLVPQLGFLDKYAQLNNKGLYFSTFTANPSGETILPVFKYLGNTELYKGVTFIFGCDVTKLNLGSVIGKLSGRTGIDYLTFQANIPINPTNITVEAALAFNKHLNIANKIYFRNVDLLFEANDGDPKFSVAAMVDLKVTPDKTLQFLYKGSLEPFNQTISGGCAMLNTWKNVFGFPHFDIGGLELGLGVNFSNDEIPIPDNLSLAGKISIGGIAGSGRVGFDANQLEKNVFIGSVDNLTWNNFIGDLCSVDKIIAYIPPYVKPVFESKLNHADFKFAPPGAAPIRTLTGEYINPGFRISADGEVAGWHGNFTIDLEGNLAGLNAGFTASGVMDPIKIDANDFKIFYFTAQSGKGGPEMKFDVSTERMLKISRGQGSAKDTINYVNADVTVLGVGNANAFCLLTPAGYVYKAEGKAYGFLDATLEAQIKSFKDPLQNTYVKVEGKTGSILADVQKFVSKEVVGKGFSVKVMDKGFSLDRIFIEGKLDDLKSGAKAKVDFTIAGKKNSVGVNVTVGGGLKLAEDIAREIVNGSMPLLADADKAIQEAAKAVAATATTAATTVASTTTTAAKTVANTASTATNAVGNTATVATAAVAKETVVLGKNFADGAKDFANLSMEKTKDELKKVADKVGGVFGIGSDDNKIRLKINGQAYRVYSKSTGMTLACDATDNEGRGIYANPINRWTLSGWQFIQANDDGMLYMVSAYSGNNLNVVGDNKDVNGKINMMQHRKGVRQNEGIFLEPVPNQTGWYFFRIKHSGMYVRMTNVTPPSGNPVAAGTAYFISARHSDHILEMDNGKVKQNEVSDNPADHQLWNFVKVPNTVDVYYIVSTNTDHNYFTINDFNAKDGQQVVRMPFNDNKKIFQQFTLKSLGNDFYSFVSVANPQFVLEVDGGSSDATNKPGAVVLLRKDQNHYMSQFYFTPSVRSTAVQSNVKDDAAMFSIEKWMSKSW
jgi:hypothetical protein